jgi:hypothetical protein
MTFVLFGAPERDRPMPLLGRDVFGSDTKAMPSPAK